MIIGTDSETPVGFSLKAGTILRLHVGSGSLKLRISELESILLPLRPTILFTVEQTGASVVKDVLIFTLLVRARHKPYSQAWTSMPTAISHSAGSDPPSPTKCGLYVHSQPPYLWVPYPQIQVGRQNIQNKSTSSVLLRCTDFLSCYSINKTVEQFRQHLHCSGYCK
jgi:hypothetical protein